MSVPEHKHDQYSGPGLVLVTFVITVFFVALLAHLRFDDTCAIVALQRHATSHYASGVWGQSCHLVIDGKTVLLDDGPLTP